MTTLPVLHGTFGTTEYYISRMKAGDIANKVKIPKELEEWEGMTIEERFQREVNYNRIKKHIAPYLATDPDRFFGSIILDIYNPGNLEFESLHDLGSHLPGLYKTASHAFGFLHFGGGEVLVPLDGQHRVAALRFAIEGKDEKGNEIKDLTPSFEVAEDDVSVILVKHDTAKARKIFNKVNRYAKSTSKAENLVTSDDDIVAVITREEIANTLIGERVVNYHSNTLNKTQPYFTTLATLYDATERILEMTFDKKIDTTTLPDQSTQKLYRNHAKETWESILNGIDIFRAALNDTSESGDDHRKEIRSQYLLGKPIAQFSVIVAFMRLRSAEHPDGSRFGDTEIFDRLNQIDWSISNPLWQRVLMNGDKIVSGKQSALFASRFISYLAGEPLEEAEIKALQDNYRSLFPQEQQGKIELPQNTQE